MHRLLQTIRDVELHSTGKWLGLSAIVGVMVGVLAIVFQWLIAAIQYAGLIYCAHYSPADAVGETAYFMPSQQAFIPWMIVVVMLVGGLISGLLVYHFAPQAQGAGTDAAIDAFHNQRGEIDVRVPLVKTLASAVTLGTGGSAGREGPIAHIAAGIGAFVGERLQLSRRDRRILLAAGMGAGVGALFRAPLAGALFAGEILYRDADLEADAIVPAAMSSTVAYSVYCLSMSPAVRFIPMFGRDVKSDVGSPIELLPYALLALVLVAAGFVYVRVFRGMSHLFARLPVVPHVRPMIGAGLAALTGIGLFSVLQSQETLAVLGSGYGLLQKVFTGDEAVSIRILLIVAVFKMLTASLTIGSGGSGGVFGPSMVIGGCVGGACGQLFQQWWPDVVVHPEAFAIVGMGGFFAGCARAPLSTILMVSELTGNYRLLLPTMWVSMICFLLSRWTLYEKQVPTRLDSPAHRGDLLVDVLEGICVKDVCQQGRELVLISEGDTLDDIVHTLAKTPQRYFPVVDADQKMVGIFSAEDVRHYLYDDTIWQIANARDVMVSPVMTVTLEDDLNMALKRFTSLNVDELPVVDSEDPGKIVGMIRRKESIAAYNHRLMEHKRAVQQA